MSSIPRFFRLLLSLSVLLLGMAPLGSLANEISGRVVAVQDGDTFTILTADNSQKKVRLSDIDAPELSQPFGQKSKQALSSIVFGKNVKVTSQSHDRYGRVLGRVSIGPEDVNLGMVERGFAWAYLEYTSDAEIIGAEEDARSKRLGLWGLQSAQTVPPWDWRNPKRSANAEMKHKDLQRKVDSFRCTGKRYCKQMISCEEARHYLNVCGVSRLDGDGDGVPCEAICR